MVIVPDSCRVVGLVGPAAAGKDYVAAKLEERGFVVTSGSNILRELIRARGLSPNRELQTSVANEVRKTKGGTYFIFQALERALADGYSPTVHKGVVITGIYAPVEGVVLKQQMKGTLVNIVQSLIDSPEERFRRVLERADGSRDVMNFASFLEAHQRENSGTGLMQANVSELGKLATYTVVNDGDGEYLNRQINLLLGDDNE